MPINKASQRGTKLGPGHRQKGKSHVSGWKLTMAWTFPAGLIGNGHTHQISLGGSVEGRKKPFITHSHKTQVFPTKQNTVKCFRTAKALELMVHWNKSRSSREENMRLLNPWGRNPIFACTVWTGLVYSQLRQKEIARVTKKSKNNGLSHVGANGCLPKWETTLGEENWNWCSKF